MNRPWLLCILSLAMFVFGMFVFQWYGSDPISVRVQNDGGLVVKEGQLGKVRVILTNHRGSPFHVDNVSTSCGCMQPKTGDLSFDKGSVLREKSDTPIDIEIGTAGKAGKAQHTLRVVGFFDNPAKPYAVEAKIAIEVVGGVRIVPTEVLLADAEAGKPLEFDILILDGGSGDSANVEVARLSNEATMKGEFQDIDQGELRETPAKGFVPKRRYRLTYVPRGGRDLDQEYIDFDVPGAEAVTTFRVSVLCRKKAPELTFSPPSLSIGAHIVDAQITREILCLSNGRIGGDLAVLSKPDDVRADVKRLRDGRQVIVVSIPAQRAADGEKFEIRIGPQNRPTESLVYHVTFMAEHE